MLNKIEAVDDASNDTADDRADNPADVALDDAAGLECSTPFRIFRCVLASL